MNIDQLKSDKKESRGGAVNHPSHYNVIDRHGQGHECIDIIEALELNFNIGNAFKYIWRSGTKISSKEMEDLKKTVFYLIQEIERLEHEKQLEHELLSAI